MTQIVRRLSVAAFTLIGVIVCVTPARAVEVTQKDIQDRRCLNCHGQSRLATMPPGERAAMVAPATAPSTQPARPGLHVTSDALAGSVHKTLACIDCHRDAETLPHGQDLAPASCNASCHSQPVSDFTQGAHAVALARNDPLAPNCTTCHG